jgi:hypothetical protein
MVPEIGQMGEGGATKAHEVRAVQCYKCSQEREVAEELPVAVVAQVRPNAVRPVNHRPLRHGWLPSWSAISKGGRRDDRIPDNREKRAQDGRRWACAVAPPNRAVALSCPLDQASPLLPVVRIFFRKKGEKEIIVARTRACCCVDDKRPFLPVCLLSPFGHLF